MRAPSPRTVQLTLLTIGVVLLMGAAVEVALSRLGKLEGSSLGASAIAPLLVFTAAVFGVKSWSDERDRRRNEEREKVYIVLCSSLLARFGTGPQVDLGQLRSTVAVWGSVEVVESLRDWNQTYDRVVSPQGDQPHYQLDEQSSAQLRTATTAVVAAVRRDLNSGNVKTGLEWALFNQS